MNLGAVVSDIVKALIISQDEDDVRRRSGFKHAAETFPVALHLIRFHPVPQSAAQVQHKTQNIQEQHVSGG